MKKAITLYCLALAGPAYSNSFEHLDQATGGIESVAGGGASLEGSSQQAFRSQLALGLCT